MSNGLRSITLYLSTRNLTITSNFFRCTMYLVSHSVLCHRLVKQHSRNDKKNFVRSQCTTKLTHVSSLNFNESHTSHGQARHQIRDWSESGCSRELLTPGTSDSCRPRGVVTRDFSANFGRLFESVWPSSRSNFDPGPWPLDSTEKIFHIRAYVFLVQFSFNLCPNPLLPLFCSKNNFWQHKPFDQILFSFSSDKDRGTDSRIRRKTQCSHAGNQTQGLANSSRTL